ncbi:MULTISPECIES: GlcG/HbpS family heme-binding protein [unclassified Helicobacter]|uniref:GlcG/HbpS family heme-binding protein n=1 Tax=unclassified Helicobacter TaxID=2593540 RepID=UPI000CF07524|nr:MULTISPECIES: heme-binding protein [unclassified Helicobacter]
MRKFLVLNFVFLGCIFAALPQYPVLTTDLAIRAAQESMKQCKNDGYAVTVTVVDNRGNTLVVIKNEEAGTHTLQASFKKAYTAMSMKNPTSVIVQNIEETKASERLINLNDNFVFIEGGLPIVVDNFVVGGIGVDGALDGRLDEKCAQIGIDSIQMFLGE